MMELDEFKNLSDSGISAEQKPLPDPQSSMDDLIRELKVKDQERKKAMRILLMSFTALAVIYITSVARNEGFARLGYLMLGGSFSILIVYFSTKYFRMRKIDYSAPIISFLRDAKKRYKYWSLSDFIVSVPMLLVLCTGGGLIVYASFQKYFPGSVVPMIIYLTIFASALSVGSWAGRKQWKKQYSRTYGQIVRLIAEFES